MKQKRMLLPFLLSTLLVSSSTFVYAEYNPLDFFEETTVKSFSDMEDPDLDFAQNQTTYDLSTMLKTSLQPVGQTMYVWGGGWNKEDTAAGKEARSIGLSDRWKVFMEKQSPSYNYKKTRYQIHNGLDCSGYVGWTLYNLFHTEDGEEGYVMKARDMAKNFSERGWGTFTSSKFVKDYKPGDIMSNAKHVYIVLGSCSDGSVVLVHASPPGVQINGTVDRKGNKRSEAARLANKYMKTYYPEWYKKYKVKILDKSYLRSYHQMRWNIGENQILRDEEGLRSMNAKQVLSKLFYEN